VAKKSRTPAPPRKVQAPKKRVQAPRVRTAPASQADVDRRRRLILYVLAGSGLAALGVVVLALFAFGGSASGLSPAKAAAAIRAGGCTYKSVAAALSGQHISVLTTRVKYNTFPPTSGKHYFSPAPWDFYDEPVNAKILVHNEEHGGMIIWYGTKVSQGTKDELRRFYNEDPNAIVVTPLPVLGKQIAMTAWTSPQAASGEGERPGQGHVATCTRFNEGAFKAFRDAFRGNGPERIPIELSTPGT
jgi:uncharacterized protein DUF3105